MRNIPSTDLSVHPLCLGGNVFGWTADEAESFAVLDAYAAAGGNFVDTADGYSQWVPGPPRRRVGGDRRALDGGARQPRRDRPRHQGRLEVRSQGARGRQRAHRDRGVAAAPADRPHRPALHPPRRRGDGARGDARRARRARARGQGPPRRRLERLARAPGGGDGRQRARGARALRRAAAALQPRRARLRERAGRRLPAPRPRLPAVLRAGQGLSHGQVPPGRRRRPEPARARAPAPTSTSAASACSRPSTRRPPRTTRRSPR